MRAFWRRWQGLTRALRIWRAVLQLLVWLWWDAQAWSYPGGATPERLQPRGRRS